MAKQQTMVNGLPESDPSAGGRHPRLYGTLVGLGVFAVVAVPAAWMGMAAVWSFTGCFITCTQPDPLVGTFWALSALVLLALPVFVGAFTARAISRRRGYVSVLVVRIFARFARQVS